MTKDKMLQVLDYYKAEMKRLRDNYTDKKNENLSVQPNPMFTVEQNEYLRDLLIRSLIHGGNKMIANMKEDIAMVDHIYRTLLDYSKKVYIDNSVGLLGMVFPILNGVNMGFEKTFGKIHCMRLNKNNDKYDKLIAIIFEGNTIGNMTELIMTVPDTIRREVINFYLPDLTTKPKETTPVVATLDPSSADMKISYLVYEALYKYAEEVRVSKMVSIFYTLLPVLSGIGKDISDSMTGIHRDITFTKVNDKIECRSSTKAKADHLVLIIDVVYSTDNLRGILIYIPQTKIEYMVVFYTYHAPKEL